MSGEPNLGRGSLRIDLRAFQEGTHPLVLGGGEVRLVVEAEAGRILHAWRFEGELSRWGEDYRVRGSLTGNLETVCDRCLARFERRIRTGIDVRARLGDPARGGGEDVAEGALRLAPDGAVLDLTDGFREAVLLEVPIKNVCREDCRGLCPDCGANRNEGPCGCGPGPGDPRWDALREALPRLFHPADPTEE